MKYYTLKYVEELKDGFAGWANFFTIKIKKGYEDDLGLLEHEKVHVKEWWSLTIAGGLLGSWLASLYLPLGLLLVVASPFLQNLLYRHWDYYRFYLESKAYRKQVETNGDNNYEFAVDLLVNKYGLDITREEAEEAIDP